MEFSLSFAAVQIAVVGMDARGDPHGFGDPGFSGQCHGDPLPSAGRAAGVWPFIVGSSECFEMPHRTAHCSLLLQSCHAQHRSSDYTPSFQILQMFNDT